MNQLFTDWKYYDIQIVKIPVESHTHLSNNFPNQFIVKRKGRQNIMPKRKKEPKKKQERKFHPADPSPNKL